MHRRPGVLVATAVAALMLTVATGSCGGGGSSPAAALAPGGRGASVVIVGQPVSSLAGSIAAAVIPGQTLRELFRLPATDQGVGNVQQFSDGSGSITTKVSQGEVAAESTYSSPKNTESDAVTVTMSIVAATCPAACDSTPRSPTGRAR
jgi:hypothetical protein